MVETGLKYFGLMNQSLRCLVTMASFSSSGVGSLGKIGGNVYALVFKSILERSILLYAKRKMP